MGENIDPTDFLIEMLKIYSPTDSDEALGDHLRDELRRMGFKPRRDEFGNIWAEIGTSSPAILLAGHFDTVPGFIPVKIDNGKIFGRGAVDAKASLAAMILAASNFLNKEFEGKIVLGCTSGEEKCLVKLDHLPQTDYAVFGEPTGYGICVSHKGRLLLNLTIKCKGGHVAASWAAENAIEIGIDFWNGIKEKFEKYKLESLYFSTVPSLTILESHGWSDNTIPSECRMTLDTRFPPTLTSDEVLSEINDVIKEKTELNSIEIKYEVGTKVEGYRTRKSSPIARALFKAVNDVVGITPEYQVKTGSSVTNDLSAMGIPSVTFGPGDSSLEHSENEYISIEEYLTAIKIYEKTIENLFSIA